MINKKKKQNKTKHKTTTKKKKKKLQQASCPSIFQNRNNCEPFLFGDVNVKKNAHFYEKKSSFFFSSALLEKLRAKWYRYASMSPHYVIYVIIMNFIGRINVVLTFYLDLDFTEVTQSS